MVALQVSTTAGLSQQVIVREFPFRIGRSEGNSLQLTEPGVWAEHLVLEFDPAGGAIAAVSQPEAVSLLNGQRFSREKLRGGDVLQLGACKIVFSFSPPPQRSMRPLEFLAWCLILSVTACQAALILLLARGS